MDEPSDDEYDGPVVIKERPAIPEDLNKLPPIAQVGLLKHMMCTIYCIYCAIIANRRKGGHFTWVLD